MVGFGSGQGMSIFETAGITCYFEDFKKAKTQPWAKRRRFRMGTIWHIRMRLARGSSPAPSLPFFSAAINP
jgi:hypothetical protein